MSTKKTKQVRRIDDVACVILAGGQGTRLYPLTQKRCKPSVRFGGRYRLIDIPISNSLNSQLSNIFVISQFFSSSLHQHILETYQFDRFQGGNIEILTPQETTEEKIWFEGTADAVRKNIDHLTENPTEFILILSGDQLYNMDLHAMVDFARSKDADLTIASLPVSEEEAPRLGLMAIDETCKIVDFKEKPKDLAPLESFKLSPEFLKEKEIQKIKSPCYLASMGIYVFKREALVKLLKEDAREDFGKHLIPTQMKKGGTYAFLHQGYWEDIGTVKSFYEANLALTTSSLGLRLDNELLPIYSKAYNLPGALISGSNFKDSIICQGAIVEAKEVTHCVIGVRCKIGVGTILRHSVLMGNELQAASTNPKDEPKEFHIGKNCHIENAIIDENCIIGDNVKLLNEKKLDSYDGDGIFIRDGIIVVSSGTVLPDGFQI